MLNKLKFNNLVISNKKGIQQSRIQTINKLVHKIRKLKTLLEKKPKDVKCKERIRKSTESMLLLKKFKRVEIMKHVLLLEKPAAAVITNGLSTPEELAVALLAMNKVMQGLIKRFKTELELTDSGNGTWREDLRENSKRKQKIERTEQKKLKRKVTKEQKLMEHKRKEWLEQNFENDDNIATTLYGENNISTAGIWKVEEIDVENPMQTVHLKPEVQTLSKVPDKKVTIEKENIVRSNKELKMKPNAEKPKIKKLITNAKPKIKIESLPKTINMHEPHSLAEGISSEQDMNVSENEETHVADPFFFTDTGESYLSTAVIKSNTTQQVHNDENQKNLHMVKLNGSKKFTHFHERKQDQSDGRAQQQRNRWSNNDERRGAWKQSGDRNQKTHNDKKPWQTRNANNSKLLNYSAPQIPNNDEVKLKQSQEKLHPSWAAKQKLKPVITSFQGKRIKFDDDGTSKDTVNKTPFLSNAKFSKKDTSASSKDNADALHPSWAAKQKHKPIIAAFQGKKITFDNDD